MKKMSFKHLFRHWFILTLMIILLVGGSITSVFADTTYDEVYDFKPADSTVSYGTLDEACAAMTKPSGETLKVYLGKIEGTIWASEYEDDGETKQYIEVKFGEGGTYEITRMHDGTTPTSVPTVTTTPSPDSNKSGTSQAVDAINQIKQNMNIHADLNAAAGTLEPLVEVVNTIVGALATAILILVGLFTAIDVLYLEVPAFHNTMDQKGMEKGTTNKSGGVKHKLISEDASQAYEEASKDGKNPLIIYLKKRIVAYVAVAIVLYMLLSGNLSLIVEVVLKMLNGIFGWVEEYSQTIPTT